MSLIWVRRVAWVAVVLVVVWLLSMTLNPGTQPNGINLVPFSQKRGAVVCLWANCPKLRDAVAFLFVDLLGNIAVFVPFGAALAVATLPSVRKSDARRSAPWPGRMSDRPDAVAASRRRGTLPRLNRPGRSRFGWRWWSRIFAASFLFSLSIELVQLFIPTRATDVDDVILNIAGALAGAALVRGVCVWRGAVYV